MRETLQILAEENRIDDITVQDSAKIYNFLTGELQEDTKHGHRFGIRPFDLNEEITSPLDASSPYVVCNGSDSDTQLKIARSVGNFIMPEDNFEALVTAFQDIYSDKYIIKQKKLGKSILFLGNHLTYADLPVELAASTVAKLRLGIENPQATQDTIVHRLISLFAHDLISTVYQLNKLDEVKGYIMEDILLVLAGVLQTLPNSNSGYTKMIQEVKDGAKLRKDVNSAANQVFPQLCRLGGRDFFVAGSGQEASFNEEDGRLHEKQIGKGTAEMLTGPNAIKYAEQIITIPLYIHADPFTGDKDTLLSPQPTPFVFLEPRDMIKPSHVHDAMSEVIAAGNMFKPSGVPQLTYDTPGPDWVHKEAEPKILISHSV